MKPLSFWERLQLRDGKDQAPKPDAKTPGTRSTAPRDDVAAQVLETIKANEDMSKREEFN